MEVDLTPQIRGLLAAIFLQALKDAQKDGYLGEQARQWIIDTGSEITRQLYGFDIDGLALLTLLDGGKLEPILRYKPIKSTRPEINQNRTGCPTLDPALARVILINLN